MFFFCTTAFWFRFEWNKLCSCYRADMKPQLFEQFLKIFSCERRFLQHTKGKQKNEPWRRTWAEGSGERLELQCFFLFRRLLIFRHHLSGDGKPFSDRETRRCNCMQLHFGDTFLERSRLTSSTLKPRMKNWLKLSDKKELQHYANWQSFSLPSSAAFRVWTRVGRVGVIVDIHTAKTRHWS